MLKLLRSTGLALLLASPTMPAGMHIAAHAQGQAPQLSYQPLQPVAQPLAPAWDRRAARELLAYVENIGAEGLDPADYQPGALRAAIQAGDPAHLGELASEIFTRLSSDLALGHVRGADRVDWHMEGFSFNGHDQEALMVRALSSGVAPALDSLHPTHPQYAALRRALAASDPADGARRDLIRANMDRWRWMPRDLGQRHILVNVPAFTAAIVEDGNVVARHRTIVGTTRTPTPQLSAMATGVTFNPWWTVPQSIIREMNGRFAGYEVRRQGDYLVVRQRPGPRNALGRMKIEMPNEHAIFLHDTPARHLFSRDVRAFSHGCIRTQDALGFATTLLSTTGEWERARVDQAVAAGETRTASLDRPVPVYIAYFTAAATSDGDIVTYNDIYGRDRRVRQALNNQARTGDGLVPASSMQEVPSSPDLN